MIFSDGYSRPFDAMSLQDTASGVALWRQVADGIERGIADGRFAAGDRLPGETEIAETYRDVGRIYERMRSVTKLLAHSGVREYRRASTRVTAAIVDATDAARLDLALGRPVLVVDSTDVDAEGTPLVTKHTRFAAERIEFVVENS